MACKYREALRGGVWTKYLARTVAIDNPDLPSRDLKSTTSRTVDFRQRESFARTVQSRQFIIRYLRRLANTKSSYICHTTSSVGLNLHSTKRLDMLPVRAIACPTIDSPLAKPHPSPRDRMIAQRLQCFRPRVPSKSTIRLPPK